MVGDYRKSRDSVAWTGYESQVLYRFQVYVQEEMRVGCRRRLGLCGRFKSIVWLRVLSKLREFAHLRAIGCRELVELVVLAHRMERVYDIHVGTVVFPRESAVYVFKLWATTCDLVRSTGTLLKRRPV